jgi:hypothetical protein
MNPKGSHKGGAPRKYGRDVRTKIRELYKSGLTPPRIAFLIGCSHMTVRRELGLYSTD